MLRLFFETGAEVLLLAYRSFFPGAGRPRPSARRLVILAGFIPFFTLALGIHWVGLLLDEIFYRGYRRVAIREPLFVLGVPRSGTTHLHRLIAEDPRLTTFSTWECLFAPSVTARRFWHRVGRLDGQLGRPLARLLGWVERRAFKGLEAVHPMRLSDPEEDYFALIPVLASFILILPFPHSQQLWRVGAFDRDMPEEKRQRLLAFYYRCLQKHLYVAGPGKRLLSKNAAFAPLAGSLAARFPDARFLVCVREPQATLPSQLSSLEPGLAFFDVPSVCPDFRSRLTEQLGFYYKNLERALGELPEDRCVWVTMRTLQSDLKHQILAIYARLGLPINAEFRAAIDRHARAARTYQSPHGYSLEQFGLSRETIDRDLGPVYERLAARSLTTADGSASADRMAGPRGDSKGSPSTREPVRHDEPVHCGDQG